MVIINEVQERRLCTFALCTGFSYKLSKNDPHLTEFKDFIDSFQFEFYVVYFELIYSVCCSELGLVPTNDITIIIIIISTNITPLFRLCPSGNA